MIAVLRECGALARILPEIDATFRILSPRGQPPAPDVPDRLAARLDRAAQRRYAIEVRYALLVLDLDEAQAQSLARRVNTPTDCRALAQAAIRDRTLIAQANELDADTLLAVLERADAFRRPERLERLVEIAQCDAPADAGKPFLHGVCLQRAAEAARGVDAGAVAKENPDDIPAAVRRARLVAIAALQK
jgi:tRNA nucleotidyltransferase (CCA-adding enzyme)